MSDALSPETLARQITVRYRSAGHTRFALPVALCEEPFAHAIEENLCHLPGIYRATLYRRQGKLSVFYDPHTCELHDVAFCLYGALAAPAAQKRREVAITSVKRRLHVAQPLHWLKGNIRNLKAKIKLLFQFASARVRSKPALQNILSEKSIISFLNDVVVFYLIKTHWELISQKWLKQPLKYRNAWLTTFYLLFLLVRFRKQPAKKP